MSSEPPTFLLAHGAWHQPHLYAPLKQALATLGYSLIVPALPTMGANAIGIGWDSDVKALLDSAEALFSQGKEIILVGHSYGGIPACIATRNNGVLERKSAGQRGGFRQIIFVCAFVMPAVGMSQASLMRHKLPPWQQLIESKGMKQVIANEKAKDALYNDMSLEKAHEYFDALMPQSYAAAEMPVDFAVPDITIPKTYVVCDNDQAFPTAAQHKWSNHLGLRKMSVSGGHSAFASTPDELAAALVQICESEGNDPKL